MSLSVSEEAAETLRLNALGPLSAFLGHWQEKYQGGKGKSRGKDIGQWGMHTGLPGTELLDGGLTLTLTLTLTIFTYTPLCCIICAHVHNPFYLTLTLVLTVTLTLNLSQTSPSPYPRPQLHPHPCSDSDHHLDFDYTPDPAHSPPCAGPWPWPLAWFLALTLAVLLASGTGGVNQQRAVFEAFLAERRQKHPNGIQLNLRSFDSTVCNLL